MQCSIIVAYLGLLVTAQFAAIGMDDGLCHTVKQASTGCRKALYLMHWPEISHIIACRIVSSVIGTWQCSTSMTLASFNES